MKAEGTKGLSLLENRPSTPKTRLVNLLVTGIVIGAFSGLAGGTAVVGLFVVAAVREVGLEFSWIDVGVTFTAAAIFLVGAAVVNRLVRRELEARDYDLSKSYFEDADEGSA